jgi:predicted O-methyltransferase YrrM
MAEMTAQDLINIADTKTVGNFNLYDVEILVEEIKKLQKGDVYLEIGVDRGYSFACAWYDRPEGVEAYGVDINDTPERRQMFETNNMKEFYHEPSQELAKRWDKKIDVLLIDGDHSFEGVMADLESWLPHMKEGGVILMHDHCSGTGVMQGTSMFFASKNVKYDFPVMMNGQLSRSSIARIRL